MEKGYRFSARTAATSGVTAVTSPQDNATVPSHAKHRGHTAGRTRLGSGTARPEITSQPCRNVLGTRQTYVVQQPS